MNITREHTVWRDRCGKMNEGREFDDVGHGSRHYSGTFYLSNQTPPWKK